MYSIRKAVSNIRTEKIESKPTKYRVTCQCCERRYNTSSLKAPYNVCTKCGWVQQQNHMKYTGQNPVGIRMYRFLLKLMKGSI